MNSSKSSSVYEIFAFAQFVKCLMVCGKTVFIGDIGHVEASKLTIISNSDAKGIEEIQYL